MRVFLVIAVASHVASAAPDLDHVVAVPTAFVPAANGVTGTAGLDRYGATSIDLGYGLGGLAEVELGADSDSRACDPCSHDDPAPSIYLGHAMFRLGLREGEWFDGQPALVFGVRAKLGAGRAHGEAYVVASKHLGVAVLHAGVAAIDAADDTGRMGTRIRPLAGALITPPQVPKSSIIADVAWLPRFTPAGPALEYAISWGVRYQAFEWGSIELVVRQRQQELDAPDVMVRVTATLGSRSVTLARPP